MTEKPPWLLPAKLDCKPEPDDQEEMQQPEELEEPVKLEESEKREEPEDPVESEWEPDEPGWEPDEPNEPNGPDEQEGIFHMLDVLEKATDNLLSRSISTYIWITKILGLY